MQVFIDIETIPNQDKLAISKIAEDLEVKAPSNYNKPDYLKDLNLDDQGKYKTIPELKDLWVKEFSESKKIEQAEDKWLKSSFNGSEGELCCVGISTCDSEVVTYVGSELDILSGVNDFVSHMSPLLIEKPKPIFIAHNKAFDLPFLFKRMVINKVEPSFKFNPYDRAHICTMELWEGFNGKVSLNSLAKTLGLGGKFKGMDGSQVWPEFKAGNIGKIAEYCKDDVRLLKSIYNTITFNY